MNVEDGFLAAIRGAGMEPPPQIRADGKLHRFSPSGKRGDDAAWYVLHGDGIPAGAFGDWRSGISTKWRADVGRKLTPEEVAEHRKRMAKAQRSREEAEKRRHAKAMKQAAELWGGGQEATTEHPYLVKKGVGAYGLRTYHGDLVVNGAECDGALMVPLRDMSGALTTLEFIQADGEKLYLGGGAKQGSFYVIGEPGDPLIICEGFATGASIHEATGYAVACAMDAGNLKPVALALHDFYRDAQIVIAADNDKPDQKGRRRGQEEAAAAAEAVRATIATPATEGTDWNDVHKADGADAVRAGIEGALDVRPTADEGNGEELPPLSVYDDETMPEGTSEEDLALLFSARHEDDLKYVTAWGRWLIWDGARWKHDETVTVIDMARKLCREVLAGTPNAPEATRKRLGSAHTVYAVVKLAQADRRHAVAVSQLDADPWLLNTPGGTLDLRTGQLKPHNRSELHTKITAATPAGECPLFLKVLARAQPEEEMQRYVQRLAGYGMTGSSRDHVLPFFYGGGRNGKGTIAHTIRKALGDYGLDIPAETLMEAHGERHPTELARFHGARFVVGSEIDEGRRWNESRIKRLTGGDPLTARYMQKDFFTFDPTHTLLIVGNSKPGLRRVDEAIRARIHLVPFNGVIPAGERDTKLTEKLEAEYGGILAWALAGCLEWQQCGMNPPETIQDATGGYLEGEDSITTWADECCERCGQITLKAAFASYREWCDRSGVPALGRNSFGDALESRGFARSQDRNKQPLFSGLSMPIPQERRYGDDY